MFEDYENSSLLSENPIDNKKFYFQHRRGHLDIRTLARVDLDNIVNNVDIDTLQNLLENITFCNIKESDLKFLTDPLILKLFRLTQLIIEYLLFVQEELVQNVSKLAKKYSSKKRDLIRKRRELAALSETAEHLQRKVKLKRENIKTLESLLREASIKRKVSQSIPSVITE